MKKWQKGQELLEMALVLPLLFIFLFGIIYFGIAYGDYIKINNAARSAAREAAIVADSAKYDEIGQAHEQDYAGLVTQTIKQTNGKDIYIEDTNNPPNSVHVQIQTSVNEKFGIPTLLGRFGVTPLDGYNVNYYMYKESSQS